MQIGKKILLSFTVIIASIVIMGYLIVTTTQDNLIANIGQDYSQSLSDVVSDVVQGIDEKTYGLIELSDKDLVYDILDESNSQSVDLTDSQISETNTAWNDALDQNQILPLMNEISGNDLSEKLVFASNLVETKFSYPIYDQIGVFNQIGILVAYDRDVPEYYVNNAEWWSNTVSAGYFVGEVSYDDDSGVYSQDIAIRIDNENGEFLGVLKTTIKLQDLIGGIHDLQQTNKFLGTNIFLHGDKGQVIYSTTGSEFGENIPLVEFLLMSEESDYYIAESAEGSDILKVYAKPDQTSLPLGWNLVVEKNIDDVLSPVIVLTNIILIVLVTTIMSAIIVGLYIKTSISKPLIELRDASSQIADGNFDVYFDIKTDDEIGDLANKFEYMRDSINFTNSNLTDLVKLRTDELERALSKIEKTDSWTKSIMGFISKQTNQSIDDISKNADLLKNNKLTKDQVLRSIDNALSQLKLLTATVTDISNLEQGQLTYDMNDVKINEVITSSLKDIEQTTKKEVVIDLEQSDKAHVFADSHQLGRALRYIVDIFMTYLDGGAIQIKTTSDENNITIQLTSDKKMDSDIFSPLNDNDVGISQTDHVLLYMAKVILKDHAGTTNIDDSDDKTIISISVPVVEV